MKTRKTKELKTRNGLNLLKKQEMYILRGGNEGPSGMETKDEILE